jgi:transposase-like protein
MAAPVIAAVTTRFEAGSDTIGIPEFAAWTIVDRFCTALAASPGFSARRGVYPAMIKSWETSWAEFVPFLEFPTELRHIVYTTNAIESLNARFRRAVRHRGHFPNEQAALKVLYLVANQRRVNRENMTGKISGWKHILNTLSTHYGDRINEAIN